MNEKGCLRVHHDEAVSTRISCARSIGDVRADGQRCSSVRVARELVPDASAKWAGSVFRKDRFRCVRHAEDFEDVINKILSCEVFRRRKRRI